jgi:glutamate dehydrogenase (NAD(P)+)
VYSILAACEKIGLDISKAKISVQGFGNVGSVAAKKISEYGARVIAVSDISGGVLDINGIDINALTKYVAETGGVKGFSPGQAVSNDDVITADCDILIPAATQSQITLDNCIGVKARIIAEGANSPTEPEADEQLCRRGVFIIPDILCNAGGVFVSYLEYTQETQREQMTREQVEGRLKERMTTKFHQVYEYADSRKLSMRQAAMDIAVGRVVEALVALGALP